MYQILKTVETINDPMLTIDKDNPDLKWYTKGEIQTLRRDANMISRAFAIHKFRRERNKIDENLVPAKTVCTLGLEYKINYYKRELEKTSAVQLVLNAQKKFQKVHPSKKINVI